MEEYQIQQRVQIDFARAGAPPRVFAKQYDNSMRVVAVELYNGGVPFAVPPGYDVNIRLDKRDGRHVYNPALLGSGNTVFAVLTRQMLCHPGELAAEIEVVQGENVLKTAAFTVVCAPSAVPDSAIQSADEYKTIQEVRQEVEAAAQVVRDNEEAIRAIPGRMEEMRGLVDRAETASAHPPYIGENGNWYTWNGSGFADSGESSVGPPGKQGEDGAPGPTGPQGPKGAPFLVAGSFDTLEALETAHPAGDGDNSYIVAGTVYAWDGAAWQPVTANISTGKDPYLMCDCVYDEAAHTFRLTRQDPAQAAGAYSSLIFTPDRDYGRGDAVIFGGRTIQLSYQSGVEAQDGLWLAGQTFKLDLAPCAVEQEPLGVSPWLHGPATHPGTTVEAKTTARDLAAIAMSGETAITGAPSPESPATITGRALKWTLAGEGQTRTVETGVTLYSLPDGTRDTYDGVDGKLVQRVGRLELDGTEAWESWTSGGHTVYAIGITPQSVPQSAVYQTHFRHVDSPVWIIGMGEINQFANYCVDYDDGAGGVDAFKTWLAAQKAAGTPVTVLYALAAPIVTYRNTAMPCFEGTTTITGADTVTILDGRPAGCAATLGGLMPYQCARSNKNLLVAADYRVPVNPRGQTSYNEQGSYSLPMLLVGENAKVEVLPSGSIKVSTKDTTRGGWIAWRMEDLTLHGKTLTGSLADQNGVVHSGSGVLFDADHWAENNLIVANGWRLYLQRDDRSESSTRLVLNVWSGQTVTIEAAKLEMGTTSTLWVDLLQPPDYAAQLRECQRYLLVLPKDTEWIALAATGPEIVWGTIPTPEIMAGPVTGAFDPSGVSVISTDKAQMPSSAGCTLAGNGVRVSLGGLTGLTARQLVFCRTSKQQILSCEP